MSRPSRHLENAIAAALGLLVWAEPAFAADMPLKAPALQAIFDWTGLYVGAHAGLSRVSSNAVLGDPASSASQHVFDGMIGGVQAGYNYRLPSGLLLGIETDISLPNYFTSNKVVSSLTTARSGVVETWDYTGTARGRLGYAAGAC